MSDTITVVTGTARCGSSLAMQMLYAGGVPMLQDDPQGHVPFAYRKAVWLPRYSGWLALEARGKAVKILDPHIFTPPSGERYHFIWMARDYTEQAKSQIKFARFLRLPVVEPSLHALRASHVRDHHIGLRLLSQQYPHSAHMVLRFEDVLRDPRAAARRMAWFLDLQTLDEHAMAAVVVARAPECYDGMLEMTLMNNPQQEDAPCSQ